MKTVYILGAGASAELEFPVGEKLKREIRNSLKQISWDTSRSGAQKNSIYSGILAHAQSSGNKNLEPYLQAATKIISGIDGTRSIDNYLHQHERDEYIRLIGKLAIVDRILFHERRSKLALGSTDPNQTFSFESIDGTWYQKFWYSITSGLNIDSLDRRFERITFVIFNYDRCVEQFLFQALQTQYEIDAEAAKELVSKLTIFHPYGTVGTLPWQCLSEDSVRFGDEINGDKILNHASSIRTFSEAPQEDSAEIAATTDRSERVVYLGFGFIRQNLRFLSTMNRSSRQMIYATCFGQSEDTINHIRRSIASHRLEGNDFQINISLNRCSDFFDEYERSLEY